MIDRIQAEVEALLKEFDPATDPAVLEYRDRFTEEEWAVVMDATKKPLATNTRLTVLARAVGDMAVTLGLDADGDALAELIWDKGPDACRSFNSAVWDPGAYDRLDEVLKAKLTQEEFRAFEDACEALTYGASSKALRSLDTELAAILEP